MSFTSILGTSDSSLGNIVPAYDATFPSTNVYSGIYQLVPGSVYDVFMIVNDDYTYEQAQEAIDVFSETALVNGGGEGIYHFAGYRARVNGLGNLKGTFYGFNKVKSSAMKDLDMSKVRVEESVKLGNFTAQRALLRLEVTDLGEYFNITRIEIFARTAGTGYKS